MMSAITTDIPSSSTNSRSWGCGSCTLSLRKTGQFRLDDVDKMTAFADYMVPVALRLLGITSYSAELEHAINTHQMVPRDSRWEVEIRAHCVYATALLCEEVNTIRPRDKQIIIPQIHARLWTHYHTTWWPHHLTRTINDRRDVVLFLPDLARLSWESSVLSRSSAAAGMPAACKTQWSGPTSSTASTMRHLFICTLLCILPIPALAQTTRSSPQPRQAKGSDLSTNSARVLDWANRLMAKDPKVRAMAEAALVKGAGRSLPLLRRLLNRGDEDLDAEDF